MCEQWVGGRQSRQRERYIEAGSCNILLAVVSTSQLVPLLNGWVVNSNNVLALSPDGLQSMFSLGHINLVKWDWTIHVTFKCKLFVSVVMQLCPFWLAAHHMNLNMGKIYKCHITAEYDKITHAVNTGYQHWSLISTMTASHVELTFVYLCTSPYNMSLSN